MPEDNWDGVGCQRECKECHNHHHCEQEQLHLQSLSLKSNQKDSKLLLLSVDYHSSSLQW